MKRTISLCLTLLLVFIMSVPAFAEGTSNYGTGSTIQPNFTSIWSLSAGLSIDSSGQAHCTGSVTPASDSYTSYLTVSLQKYTGSGWSTVKSWSDSAAGQMGVIIDRYWYVTRGTYRVCSTAQIYNSAGSLLESEPYYSATKTY